MRTANTGWKISDSKKAFRRRKMYATPDLYDIQYINGEQINTYQFEDIQRTCNLCRRRRLVCLFYCQYPARIEPMKVEREEYIKKQSVCALCANRMGI